MRAFTTNVSQRRVEKKTCDTFDDFRILIECMLLQFFTSLSLCLPLRLPLVYPQFNCDILCAQYVLTFVYAISFFRVIVAVSLAVVFLSLSLLL